MSYDLGTLKVALVHDWLTGMRGGEKVLELLCSRFPDAPLWTLLHVPGTVSDSIENRSIKTSLLQYLPAVESKYRYYLPLFPLMAELTKAQAADIVVSSSHAVAKAMVNTGRKRPTVHICYIHTPMRYVWDRFDDYFGPERVGKLASRCLFQPVARLLRQYDLKTVDRVDRFVANSHFVADRVKRLYRRDADVVAPPVDVQRFGACRRAPEDWYLMVTALAPYKRVDDAIQACAQLKRKLKIIGSGPEETKLKALASQLRAEVEFHGFVPDDQLAQYYSRARGLLFPGVEDFGIVPVEAIAAGCPVIALRRGGILDSMTERTAVLYNEESVDGLLDAIRAFELMSFNEAELRRRALDFAPERFLREFDLILADTLQSLQRRTALAAVA